MTKKQQKEKNNKNRAWFDMNLGTIDMKSAKDYNRKNRKKDIEKEMKNYE